MSVKRNVTLPVGKSAISIADCGTRIADWLKIAPPTVAAPSPGIKLTAFSFFTFSGAIQFDRIAGGAIS